MINRLSVGILLLCGIFFAGCRSRSLDTTSNSADLAAIKPSLDFINHVRSIFEGEKLEPLSKYGEFVAVEFSKKEIAEHSAPIIERNPDSLAMLVIWRMVEFRAVENLQRETIPAKRKDLESKIEKSRGIRLNALCFAKYEGTAEPLAASWPYGNRCRANSLDLTSLIKLERENESRFPAWRDNYESYKREVGEDSPVVDNPENLEIIEAFHLLDPSK